MLELVLKHKMEKALCMVCPFWASIEAPGRVPAGSVDKELILRQWKIVSYTKNSILR